MLEKIDTGRGKERALYYSIKQKLDIYKKKKLKIMITILIDQKYFFAKILILYVG